MMGKQSLIRMILGDNRRSLGGSESKQLFSPMRSARKERREMWMVNEMKMSQFVLKMEKKLCKWESADRKKKSSLGKRWGNARATFLSRHEGIDFNGQGSRGDDHVRR